MEDRGVRSQPQKLTQEEPDNIGSANLDRGHRPGRSEQERSERERIRELIHELYEELLSLAVAARSILHWPPANEIAPENPVKRLDPNRSRTTTEDEAREAGLNKTLADSFPSSDPPSTIPDPPEPGVQRKALGASQVRPNPKRDVK
jgi:hypothetical protein